MTHDQTGVGPSARPLPEEAYQGLTPEGADRVDERLRALAGTAPSEPGLWLDRKGNPWRLSADGTWTDSTGETHDTSWNPLIPLLFGPWTRAPEERTDAP